MIYEQNQWFYQVQFNVSSKWGILMILIKGKHFFVSFYFRKNKFTFSKLSILCFNNLFSVLKRLKNQKYSRKLNF